MALRKPVVSFEDIDDIVTCHLCQERCEEPRRLPCFHSYCTKCLKELIQRADRSSQFTCHACRKEFQTPTDGAAGFPAAAFMNSLVEAVDQINSLGLNQAPKCSLCSKIDEEADAAELCITCMETLCKVCLPRHNQLLKPHELFPCHDLDANQLQEILRKRAQTCQEHLEAIQFHCDTCNQFVCLMCIALSHDGHAKTPIVKAKARDQKVLEKVQKELVKKEEDYSTALANIDEAKSDCLKLATDMKNKIEKQVEAIIKLVHQYGEKEALKVDSAIEECRSICDTEQYRIQNEKTQVSNTKKIVGALLSHGNASDIVRGAHEINSCEELLGELNAKYSIPRFEIVRDLVNAEKLKFVELISDLQCKVTRDEPKDTQNDTGGVALFSEKVKQFQIPFNPSGVGCTSEGNIVVCDYGGSSVKIFNIDGQECMDLKTPEGTRAVDVSVSGNDEIYVTDQSTGSVHVFNTQGVQLLKTIPVETKGMSCIALNGSDKMYISCKDHNEVSTLDLDGTNKTAFLKDIDGLHKPFFVAASQTHVAVSLHDTHRVNMYDKSGEQIYSYGGEGHYVGQLSFPWGLAIDPSGRLFVCDSKNDRISIVSADGRHLGDIDMKKDKLEKPQGIAINSQGQIVVTCSNTEHCSYVAVYELAIKVRHS